MRRVRYQSLRNVMRQDISFFDHSENSTGKLTNMLSTDATAMAGLSGANLGAILTLLVDLPSVVILASKPSWDLANQQDCFCMENRSCCGFSSPITTGLRILQV